MATLQRRLSLCHGVKHDEEYNDGGRVCVGKVLAGVGPVRALSY